MRVVLGDISDRELIQMFADKLEEFGIKVSSEDVDDFSIRVKFELTQQEIIKRIILTAKGIKHSGDYGQAFYNHEEKHVFWVMGDADYEEEKDYHEYSEIINMFHEIPGIQHVTVEDECEPGNEDEENSEWELVYDYQNE